MTTAQTLFGHWTVTAADSLGKRLAVRCRCGVVKTVGVDVPRAGWSESCACVKPSRRLSEAIEREVVARRSLSAK